MRRSSSVPSEATPFPPVTAVPWSRQSRYVTLPATVDTLFGRDQEIAEVVAALRCRASRLLVLTGPGGVGKTRLAIASATAAAASFEDGALFVALAPIRDPALVAVTIARAAGIRETGVQPTNVRLAEILADRDLLLVLDNFEHLLPASSLVSELLAACPTLTILMTSRTRPRLTGERDIPVQPLTLPRQQGPTATSSRLQPTTAPRGVAVPAHPDVGVDAIGESPAVRLFADRARAIDPSFRLTEENAREVAEICRRVDGLPLAIELAAARTQLLSPAALLARLDTRLPLLMGGSRDQPARLQTMRQAIGWSFDLLTAEDQAAFQCLAVFVGGFGLDAAETVCAAPLEMVEELVDQSLLQPMTADCDPRCAMLETLREFGSEQLAKSGSESSIRDRRAAWCLELATRLEPVHFGGRGQVAAVQRLAHELPNLRTAFARLMETGKYEAALQLATALARFLFMRGHNSEGREWLEMALARTPDAPAALRARGFLSLAMVTMAQQAYEGASSAIETALPLVSAEHDPKGLIFARMAQGQLAFMQGHFAEAASLGAEGEALAARIGSRWDLYIAWFLRAKAELYAGNLDEAEAISQELIAAAGDEEVYILASARHDAGTMRELRGDHAGALSHFGSALHDFRGMGEQWNAAMSLEGAATAAIGLGHADHAAFLFGAADALRSYMGAPVLLPDRPVYERGLAATRAALGEATFTECWAAGRSASLDDAIAVSNHILSSALSGLGHQTAAAQQPRPRLTPREREVLTLLVAGQSDPQIGATLNISARTVESHVAAILAKLGQPSRTAAVAHAVRHDLV